MSKSLHMVAFTLVIIGAINWGLVGLFDFNVVELVLGGVPFLSRLVYVLVGVSGIVLGMTHMKDCRMCSTPAAHTAA